MSFELAIGGRERAGSRLIARVRKALVLAADDQHVSQQFIADKLDVNRSVINRLLKGTANLTLRTVGEIAWALDLEINVTFQKRASRPGNNICIRQEITQPLEPVEYRVQLTPQQFSVHY